jgi:hypothetical protein
VDILGQRELIQPLMKRQKTFLKPQDRDQLLTYAGETICLEASSLKLQDHQSVSAQNQGYQQSQRERQTPANIEGVAVW